MEFTKLKTYIDQLDNLIRKECTGTANEFAQKLGVSERTLQNHLQQLRELGIDVIYDHYKRTYRYTKKGRISFGFNTEEMAQLEGGLRFLIDIPSDDSNYN